MYNISFRSWVEVISESEPEKEFLHIMWVDVPYESIKQTATLQSAESNIALNSWWWDMKTQ